MIPKEVLSAVEAVIACGKEVILRKEKGKWVVLENGRRLVYKEQENTEPRAERDAGRAKWG